ncbi:MAG: hypothetical protein OEV65_08690, partial [Aquincola sp.]|nr:hypothetical protein [Aquincola sp.]
SRAAPLHSRHGVTSASRTVARHDGVPLSGAYWTKFALAGSRLVPRRAGRAHGGPRSSDADTLSHYFRAAALAAGSGRLNGRDELVAGSSVTSRTAAPDGYGVIILHSAARTTRSSVAGCASRSFSITATPTLSTSE